MLADQGETFAQVPGVELHHAEDGFIAYHHQTGQVHFLNNTALVILESCDGTRGLGELANYLQKAYSLEKAPYQEVSSVLTKLLDKGLIKYTT